MVTTTGRNIVSSERTIILFLVLVALGVRLIALERICLIARDGIHYVSLARQFLSGSFAEALSHPFHPLYSLLMALAGGFIGDVELAGKLISLLLGSVTVVPVYLLGRTIYDSKVGAVAGLLFAFHPYCVRFSVDVLSDSTFLCFFGFAFYLGVRAAKSDRKAFLWSLGAGGISGLAYLTRPEGIIVPGFLLGWFILAWIGNPDKNRARTIGMATGLVLTFFCVAGPYLGFIKSYTGQWQISMKPSVSKVMTHVVRGTPARGATTSPAEIVGDPGRGDENSLVRAPAKPKEGQPRMTL
ncbi:MAG: glycosyltransferase family 39 protein, partial [Deltaproteobacteria bacterium]|nr:glycosyltransferase family 39 protein [Deltaproteobacteria bacterium]